MMTDRGRRIVAKFDDAAKLMALRRRAHRLGLLIVTGYRSELKGWELAGPYTLVCAETGYFAHAEGVNLRGLSLQISQIEEEYRISQST